LPYLIQAAGVTHTGLVRARNEDSFRLLDPVAAFMVADGMGGHAGGDVASRTATDEAAAVLSAGLPLAPGDRCDADTAASSLQGLLRQAVLSAHEAIRKREEWDTTLAGMGTTLTALALEPATGALAVGHVGDSRAYRHRAGSLSLLTRDDTWVQERVDHGDFTPDQAKGHPFAHILTQCLGREMPPAPHLPCERVRDGDTYLLCTDGLVGMIEEDHISDLLAPGLEQAPAALAERLVAAALANGGRDNVTAVVVQVRIRSDA